jgi:hypothetical protein
VFDVTLAADSLYTIDMVTQSVEIWRDISTISAAAAPDAVMSPYMGLTDPFHLSFQGDTLVVTNNDAPADYRVLLYLDAGSITGDTEPDVTVEHADLVLPNRSYLDSNGFLYVMMSDDLLIFENATTTPSLKAHLSSDISGADDLLIVE